MERRREIDARAGSPSRRHLVKLLLTKVVAPVDHRIQTYLDPHENYGGSNTSTWHPQGPLATSAKFLNWVNQGLITLAFPEMGYNPIAARRQLARTEWATEITGLSQEVLRQQYQQY